MSQIYLEAKNFPLSVKYAERSLGVARQLNLKDKIKDASGNLAEAFSKMKNFEKAFEYQKLNSEMTDSMFSDDRQKTIAEIQTKYDVEKKEKENELLNQKVQLNEYDSKQQKIVIYSIGFAAILILALAFFIYRSYRQKKQANISLEIQNDQILKQNVIIEEKNKDITDSIMYAKRIQTAILPSLEEIQKYLPESFIIYQPKDIVSGDFYWFTEKNNKLLIAVADCTGHGVPGAFMSMIGNDLLTQIVIEKNITQPNLILTQLHDGVRIALKQNDSQNETKDGMDIALLCIDKTTNHAEYAGALRPLWLIREDTEEVIEYKGDKHSIGGSYSSEQRNFMNTTIELKKSDKLYLSSDGYSDQFGGEQGKKFMTKNMKKLLLSLRAKSMDQQKNELIGSLDNWKGKRQQVDDILIIGIQV